MNKELPKKRYTAAEADVIKDIRNKYRSARTALAKDSFWEEPFTERWDKQEKVSIGWCEKPSKDEFQSNVKSPMSSGRIESTMHKLKRLNIQYVVRPDDISDPKDKRKARVVQEMLNNLFQRRYFKARLNTWFNDSLVHGPAFLHVYYLRKKRKVKQIQVDTKKMSDEEKESVKEKKKVYKEEYIYDYDDIAFEPVKLQEMFVDPSARNMHGTSYEAQWVIRRMLPSLEQFKAMFENDPEAKNVSKVRPASRYVAEETEFFIPPTDIDNDEYVELLHYYDKANDRYVVLANDVVVKDIPLPYKHKQLPFVKIDAYEVLHQFYGMGIPDKLMNIQAEEEILKNIVYDRLHITGNPILNVKKTIYGEYSKAYQQAKPGMMLPVNNQDDVKTLEYQPMNFDMFRGVDLLSRDAVIATQIDPVQMGVNQKYVSATTSMLTKEQMDTFITALIDTWTESLNILAKQCVSLMSQFYTVPRVEAAGKAAKSRKIRFQDIEINPETLEVVEKRGKYSYAEIKPDFFDINGDWDIEIAPESVEVESKAIEMQKSQANIAQLAPFMVDPSNPQSVMSNPTPWIDGPKMVEWYLSSNGIPSELMAVTVEDEDISIERAEQQGKKMLEGDIVPGIPGEPEVHKKVHVKQLAVINQERSRIANAAETLGPEYAQFMMSQEDKEKLSRLDLIAGVYAEHLMRDDQPAAMEVMSTAQDGQPPQPMQPNVPMPPGLTPAGSAQPPAPAAGNQQSGMEAMPQGRPPMAEAGM